MEIKLIQTQFIPLSKLEVNKGQVEGIPSNPRRLDDDAFAKLKKSIEERPGMLALRELCVYPHGNKFVVLGGNMRLRAMRELKYKEAPCKVIPEDTPLDELKAFVVVDNSSFGAWDYDALANEWDDLPLADFGVPVWDTSSDMKLTTKGREGGEGYGDFVDKFKQKLTTDDCYTPPEVYEVVKDFVDKEVESLKGKKVVRPFFPGGNYEDLKQYPNGSVVVDNPPFSILSKIIRFYSENGIRFFLFGPSLTLFSASDCDVTYIVANAQIVYENGANISTGFITNMIQDLRIWCCPELRDAIHEAQEDEDKTKQGFVYPDNIVTAATLGKLVAHETGLKVRKISCEYIKSSDSAEEQGRALYGGGFILSDGAAAERAAAERAAAERAAATRLNLSARERAIIEKLNAQDGHIYQPGEKGPET